MSELAGNGCQIIVPFDERKPLKEIEKSILKKYRKYTWSKFIKAIKDYKLVEEGDKIAELFTFVINDTVETEWFKQSHGDTEVISIDANNLIKVLKGEPYETYKRPVSKFTFRF